MDFIIGLLPAVGWGLQPLAVRKIGGEPVNQLFGTNLGAFLVGIILFLIMRPEIDINLFLLCFFSGASHAIGLMLQYKSFTYISLSRAMPLTTGMQLIGNSMSGVLIFGEWSGVHAKMVGAAAIALIIIGVVLTTYTENKKKESGSSGNMKKAVLLLLLSTLGFVGYSALPRFSAADGWAKYPPQSLGMFFAAVLFVIFITKGKGFTQKVSYMNLVAGLFFAFACIMYLISVSLNGLASGFAISQMLVVISTFGSIIFLKERKTKRELLFVTIGLIMVVAGGVGISLGT